MQKPYYCKIPGCNKRYTDPSSLRKHVKTYKHNNLKPENDAIFLSDDSSCLIIDESNDCSLSNLSNQSSSEKTNSLGSSMNKIKISAPALNYNIEISYDCNNSLSNISNSYDLVSSNSNSYISNCKNDSHSEFSSFQNEYYRQTEQAIQNYNGSAPLDLSIKERFV